MKQATVRTTSAHPETVGAALVPDNTTEMETQVNGDVIETTIARETTGGLRTTIDDYVVNLSVAERIAQTAVGDAVETDDRTARDSRTADDTRVTDEHNTDDTDNP